MQKLTKEIKSTFAGLAALLVGVGSAETALAATKTVTARIPPGRYVHSNNPKCGVQGPLSKLNDPEVVATVTAVNAKAGAVVYVVGTAFEVSESSGGDIAKWIKQANGPDYAACADMCVHTARGTTLTGIEWSDRDGGYGDVSLKKAKEGISNKDQKDYSGWRNFLAFKSDGQWFVCGTGTNWSGDQYAVKRIRIQFD